MKKVSICMLIFELYVFFTFIIPGPNITRVFAYDNYDEYYTIYDKDTNDVLFIRGDGVVVSDEYISSDNKLYVISEIDDETHTGIAIYKEDVTMPVISIKKKDESSTAYASSNKIVAMYHSHNDESYVLSDGTDSVYGKGGIHDIGLKLKENLENLGIQVAYSENLHLPHNSGAYSRSEQTASELINNYNPDAIFDIHRDATPRSEYITNVNGVDMSKVRMVVGSANQNSEINKEFALCIKAYADEVYPGLIKDIYIGKGNYNQQLSKRAMLFEMGCHNIEKELVLASCSPLSKTIDFILYGTQSASVETLNDVDIDSIETSSGENSIVEGLANKNNGNLEASSPATNKTLFIVIGIVSGFIIITFLFYMFNLKFRHSINRFFSELTAGIFKKKKSTFGE